MTDDKLPRIKTVTATSPVTLVVTWTDNRKDRIDLAGWIATGGDVLGPLFDDRLFLDARVAEHGTAVAWDDDDLMIDATHLQMLAAEQRPFMAEEAAEWQEAIELSNNEIADFLGIALSTWNAYKAGTAVIPVRIGMLCRAALRDPIILQAHFKPRKTGRPKKVA
jgi:hypothetical protein